MGDQELELFRGRTRRQPDELSLTLQRGGRFVISQTVVDLMGDPPMVELLFNRATQQMAIRPAVPGATFAYPLRRHQRPSTRLITGNRFTSHYGIKRDATRRYKATWDGAMLLVDLTQPLGFNEQRPAPGAPDASETPSVSSQEPVDARHSRVG